MASTTVVLADDDRLTREIVAAACAGRGISVLAHAESLAELAELCREQPPDVLVAGDLLQGVAVSESLEELGALGCKLIFLTSYPPPARLGILAADAVWGCLSHDASPDEVVEGILAVTRGGMALDATTSRTVVDQWRRLRAQPVTLDDSRRRPELTRREREVLAAMAEGLAAKAIAARLGVALKTVENHKIRVFDKLGVRTQAHAVSVAVAYGLATPAPPQPAATASGSAPNGDAVG